MMKPELQNWNKSGKPLRQKKLKDVNPRAFHIIIFVKLWYKHRNVRDGWFRLWYYFMMMTFMMKYYDEILWFEFMWWWMMMKWCGMMMHEMMWFYFVLVLYITQLHCTSYITLRYNHNCNYNYNCPYTTTTLITLCYNYSSNTVEYFTLDYTTLYHTTVHNATVHYATLR